MNPAEEYILRQEEPFKSILLHIQLLIEHIVAEADLKYKWRLPCYYLGKKPICYLNTTKEYVDVGFWHSAHLTKFDAYLVSENRKVVKSLRYKYMEDIDDDIFITILNEVMLHIEKGFYKK